jgi:diguanylate cyclase (GGDEF)-like protein
VPSPLEFFAHAPRSSLVTRALYLAVLRIGLVALCAGAVSYFVNRSSIENAVRQQLLLSTEQKLQRESLPFKEIKELERNFIAEFESSYARPDLKAPLAKDFDRFFYRHADGSYTQRPGLFEGQALEDGRQFKNMSATYAPEIVPNEDIKARFALSFLLSYKYGSTNKGRLFNFYGVVPEKGFPIYQSADIAKVFTYSGPGALKLETYEFYYRGFASAARSTLFTRIYFDYSNNAWMTTVATPDKPDGAGKHRILACVDVLLDDLMRRTAKPAIQGAYSTIFQTDDDGTLIYDPEHAAEIKRSEGRASIRSLKLNRLQPLRDAIRDAVPGKVRLVDAGEEIVAVGLIPETPWALAVHYPRALMQPSILQNLAIVIALGLVTLLVEIFIIRSILQNQVAMPLQRLMRAMKRIGGAGGKVDCSDLPMKAQDEIGDVAREFASMADRVQDARDLLENKVLERTAALEQLNRRLMALSETDELTGVANRRRFDEVLSMEWRRGFRTGKPLALMMIDVDWFKKYNDHYGHQAGDECLKAVAAQLGQHVHRAGDLLARYGGEEFSIIAPATSLEAVRLWAEELCVDMAALAIPHLNSPLGKVTISIGVASMLPSHDRSPEQLLREADRALYRAKEQGRNQTFAWLG